MFLTGIVPRVEAGISPSEAIAAVGFDRGSDIQTIRKFIEMKMVRERLAKLGFTADEVQSRLGQLSDERIHQLAQRLDDLKVGADDGLGIIIALLVIAILIVILIQLTGRKIIITK